MEKRKNIMKVEVSYELLGFSKLSGYKNHKATLVTNFPQLIHSAITVGRKGWNDVFYHQQLSINEMIFRYYLVKTFILEKNNKFVISDPYKTLDPSEKVSINYFIGSTFTKLFAECMFDTP
jgi:hypothetical protein